MNPLADINKIQTIMKPKGEAGDGQTRFNLQEAMDLTGSTEKHQIYLAIMVSNVEQETSHGAHQNVTLFSVQHAKTVFAPTSISMLPSTIKILQKWGRCSSL
jgi:hypothetical protein